MRFAPFLASIAVLAFFFGCITPQSDEAYVEITKNTVLAKQFLQKYPNSSIFVDREGGISVEFMSERYFGGERRYIRVITHISALESKPTSAVIYCGAENGSNDSATRIEQNLEEYLRTEKCLE